ncbi:hypothetical protein A5821_000324 [Enterococcus sp. 7F3_DIV0205]|uniref:Uncharacterized protein n=1 Tax=Candidatus Enterococcus palustris TaxID=1834189 RepID=A0AAQ3W5X5_9ENTE|nr:hypothetical protein [Enterococcus sp. 7F3_DIV0205]OTN84737.1 hypothetical protein A5821_000666 [Enterococcus sp. 7F3_DIV0205]
MNELIVDTFSIHYTTSKTADCQVMLDDHTYIENKTLPRYFICETKLTFFEFYQADCPELQETDYHLSKKFQQIVDRFPHTNQEKVTLNDKTSYNMNGVPIYITAKDYILGKSQPNKYPAFNKKLETVQSLTPITEEELSSDVRYKRKRLFLDGTYGARELLEAAQQKHVKTIQNKLEYINELYSFASYRYAAMIQFLPEYGIKTYDQFHEAYGKYVYSFTITKNGKTIPLLWPDYLYHKPENHLEFGLLSNTDQSRYQLFDHWETGESITIEILADGFEDVRFDSHLKQQMAFSPQLSKVEYNQDEMICLSIDPGVIKELRKQTALFELFKTKKTAENAYLLEYELLEDQLRLSSKQFEKLGRYQLKITSDSYGQLLFLFTIKQEGSVQE